MKTEIIFYDPLKRKRYYLPTETQMRTALKKPEPKPGIWNPPLRLLLIALGLMVGSVSVGSYLLMNGV